MARYFAEYQTGLQDFYPRLVEAEERITDGLVTPTSLVESENTLSDTKNFQTSLEELVLVLNNAGEIAKKMSHHEHADITVASFRIRWDNTHKSSKLWVHCMEELTKCWSDMEAKIETLTNWVATSKSSEPAQVAWGRVMSRLCAGRPLHRQARGAAQCAQGKLPRETDADRRDDGQVQGKVRDGRWTGG